MGLDPKIRAQGYCLIVNTKQLAIDWVEAIGDIWKLNGFSLLEET